MTPVKNSLERAAGIFLLLTITGASVLGIYLVRKNGWLESRKSLFVYVSNASDLRPGTRVEMSGLSVGKVANIELVKDGRVRLELSIRNQFAQRLLQGSTARVGRPFIFGEKVIELFPGFQGLALAEGDELPTQVGSDPLDLVQGKAIQESIENLASLVKNLDMIAKGLNKKGQLLTAVSDLSAITSDLRKTLPHYTQHAPKMGQDISQIAANLKALSERMNEMMPALIEVAKSAPDSSRKIAEAVHETTVLMRAIQKTFLIRGRVEEVREEEEKKSRIPASSAREVTN